MADNFDINKKIEELIKSEDEINEKFTNAEDLINEILELSKLNSEIIKEDKFYYIKRGVCPKAILHLNISNLLNKFSYKIEDNENEKIILSDEDPSILNSLIVFKSLINNFDLDFDILITLNNIYDRKKDYSNLKDIIRSDKIINFNLKQSNCIADSFASFTIVNINIPLERIKINEEDFSFFTIGLKDLVGGNSAVDIDKVRSNAIKSLLGVIRKIKSKVDIEILRFDGGNRYDNIPNSAKFDICVKKEFINDLVKIFEIEKNDYIMKTLKLEPNANLYMIESNYVNISPISLDSFSHLTSFIELSINGAYSVDTSTNQLINSSMISNASTYIDHLSLLLVFRSLSNDGLKEMIEKTRLAASVSDAFLETKYYIPPWQNKDSTLTDIFKQSFEDITNEKLKIIKTQYSLDGNLIFSSLPVKMISLGVKYNKRDNNIFYTELRDITNLTKLIENVLLKIDES